MNIYHIVYLILFVTLYTMVGILWICRHYGFTYKKEAWWEWLIYLPVLILIFIVGKINKSKDYLKFKFSKNK